MRGLIQLDVGGAILETRPGKGANLGVKRFLVSFFLFLLLSLAFSKFTPKTTRYITEESYNLNQSSKLTPNKPQPSIRFAHYRIAR